MLYSAPDSRLLTSQVRHWFEHILGKFPRSFWWRNAFCFLGGITDDLFKYIRQDRPLSHLKGYYQTLEPLNHQLYSIPTNKQALSSSLPLPPALDVGTGLTFHISPGTKHSNWRFHQVDSFVPDLKVFHFKFHVFSHYPYHGYCHSLRLFTNRWFLRALDWGPKECIKIWACGCFIKRLISPTWGAELKHDLVDWCEWTF